MEFAPDETGRDIDGENFIQGVFIGNRLFLFSGLLDYRCDVKRVAPAPVGNDRGQEFGNFGVVMPGGFLCEFGAMIFSHGKNFMAPESAE